jgi:hypothetical protein
MFHCRGPHGVRIRLADVMASRYMWSGEAVSLAAGLLVTLWRAASGAGSFRAGGQRGCSPGWGTFLRGGVLRCSCV